MCVGDWRLGRFMSSKVTNVPLTSATFTIQSNQQRVYLSVIINNPVDTLAIQSESIDDKNITVFNLQAPVFSWTVIAMLDGQLPTLPWRLFGLSGFTGTCTMIEQFLPEDVLREELNRLARGDKTWPK